MLEIFLYLILWLVIIVSSVVLTIMLIGVLIILWIKVPYAPTPRKKIQQIIDTFELKPGQKFYDLGCGDGRFVIAAAKAGAEATGFEISPWIYVRAKVKVMLARSQAKIIYKNFYTVDLTDADAVFCFLIDKVMEKVENKLASELKTGAKIICYGFELPNWKPKKIIYTNPKNKNVSRIYLYIKK